MIMMDGPLENNAEFKFFQSFSCVQIESVFGQGLQVGLLIGLWQRKACPFHMPLGKKIIIWTMLEERRKYM